MIDEKGVSLLQWFTLITRTSCERNRRVPFTRKILTLSPFRRRFLIILADSILLPSSVWISFWMPAQPFHSSLINGLWLFPSYFV